MALLELLPSSLLFVVCSFLGAEAIEFLSVTGKGLRTECTKPGAWRCVSLTLPPRGYPSWDWVRRRVTRSAAAGQLRAVDLRVRGDHLVWLLRHVSLQSVRLAGLECRMRCLRGVANLSNLRLLDLRLGLYVDCTQPLPPSLEIVRGVFPDSLTCLERCQRLRVLEVRTTCQDLSLLTKMPGLRDLTLRGGLLRGQLHQVAECTRLVALRISCPYRLDLSPLRLLPQDGLRTLALIGYDQSVSDMGEVVTHFTQLQTLDVNQSGSLCLHFSSTAPLRRLRFGRNSFYPFANVRGIEALRGLQEVHAPKKELLGIRNLYRCPQLRVLDIRNTWIVHWDVVVENCPLLEILALWSSGEYLCPLRGLRRLWCLDASMCEYVRPSLLSGFRSLSHVTVMLSKDVEFGLTSPDIEHLRAQGLRVSTRKNQSYWDEGRPFAPLLDPSRTLQR